VGDSATRVSQPMASVWLRGNRTIDLIAQTDPTLARLLILRTVPHFVPPWIESHSNGGKEERARIVANGTAIQHDSESSHSVLVVLGGLLISGLQVRVLPGSPLDPLS
jgi:hypothetical protein